ncbi:MAG: ATP-binding protein [Gammaproteobacteria bacterium]
MSLRNRLIGALLAALVATGLFASWWTYVGARREIDALFDYQLRQQALALRDRVFPLSGLFLSHENADQEIVIQVWDWRGSRLYSSHRLLPLPQRYQIGFSNFRSGGKDWRAFALVAGTEIIQVAQPLSVRRTMAARAGLRILVPILLVLPLFGLLVWWIVGRALRPLDALARTIGARDQNSLAPVPVQGLPAETRPMIRALNDLLERLARALELQRQFTADAAHELRTPLAAVRLQAQVLERAQGTAERTAAAADLKSGVDRAAHLVDGLLTLARLEPDAADARAAPLDLASFVRDLAARYAPLAAAKGQVLQVAECADARIHAGEPALNALIGNLVDNAIRYTPEGGRIDVAMARENSSAVLSIVDSGPGIPAHERARVFDRFYRLPGNGAPGSGLGLAIARRAADVLGATIVLEDPPTGTGLAVRVRIPVERHEIRSGE